MNIHYETSFLNKKEDNIEFAATIGFFDGVHKGHQYLLSKLQSISKQCNYKSMVVTFANHPREVFNPDYPISLISTNEEKQLLIESFGIDKCLMLCFDKELAKLTSEEFIKILSEKYNLKTLLVGYDHHFGSDLNSTFEDYSYYGLKYGVKVVLEKVLLENEIGVSSSKIRKALSKGDILTANSYLGYNFSFTGVVVSGKRIGRTIGFPTANILVSNKKIIPAYGVYACKVNFEGKSYIGMLNIGVRPTVNGKDVSLEVHILDYNGDLYGKEISVLLYKYIRNEKKFTSKIELQSQLLLDKVEIIDYFSSILL